MTVTDCTTCDGYTFTDYGYEICYDRKLFHVNENEPGDSDNHYPFLWTDLVATFIWFVIGGVAPACGVGGGGIFVPLGNLLLRFPPKAASGLSQASMFGATLGSFFVNLRNRHPDLHIRDTKGTPCTDRPGAIVPYEKNKTWTQVELDRVEYLSGGDGKRKFYTRPVIDFDMALLLAPMELTGALLGVTIQQFLPNWLYLIIAVVALGLTGIKTYQKYVETHKKELAKLHAAQQDTDVSSTNTPEQSAGNSPANSDVNYDPSQDVAAEICEVRLNTNERCALEGEISMRDAVEDEMVPAQSSEDDCPAASEEKLDDVHELEQRRKYLEEDSRQLPREKLAYLVILWIGLTVLTFLKGGKGADSILGITCEDSAYYVLLAAQFVWLFSFSGVFAIKNIKRTQARKAVNYPFNEHDILWDLRNVQIFCSFACFAGVVAGLIGIGGGYILGPVMLHMGVHASVSTATTATMILLTSSSVAVMFVLSGIVPWQYAVYFFCITLTGALILKPRIDAYIRRTGRASILIGLLAVIILLATCGCAFVLFSNLARDDWCLAGFRQFCPAVHSESYCDRRLLLEAREMFPF